MLVYSDETGIDDNEVSPTGWAPKGKRLHAQKKGKKKTRYNITAALNENSLFAVVSAEKNENMIKIIMRDYQ